MDEKQRSRLEFLQRKQKRQLLLPAYLEQLGAYLNRAVQEDELETGVRGDEVLFTHAQLSAESSGILNETIPSSAPHIADYAEIRLDLTVRERDLSTLPDLCRALLALSGKTMTPCYLVIPGSEFCGPLAISACDFERVIGSISPRGEYGATFVSSNLEWVLDVDLSNPKSYVQVWCAVRRDG